MSRWVDIHNQYIAWLMEIVEMDPSSFDTVVQERKDIIVDCWGTWCGHCAAVACHIERIAEEHQERVSFGKILIDNQLEFMEKFEITTQPVILFFKDGILVDRSVGLKSIMELRDKIEKYY